jgi:hypothetical protein
MKQLTESEIRGSIVNAGHVDIERMPLPGLHEVVWDDREYLGWRDPSLATRGYLVYWRGDEPVGLVLRSAEGRPQVGAAICSLCHTQQPAGQVTLFTAAKARDAGLSGNTVGTYICADLACSLLIRIAPPESVSGRATRELIADRASGLAARLDAFASRVLERAA